MGTGLLYFACGSNLHPLRLSLRVPAARFQGTLALTGYQLRFNKRGRDGSGKGNLLPTGHPEDRIWGAVYSMTAEGKERLDRFEGGYRTHWLEVEFNGAPRRLFTYLAVGAHVEAHLLPYGWYRELVLA